jgi:hypothetical protein
MRSILSERNIVVVLFVMVFITFAMAHEDTKKMEQVFQGSGIPPVSIISTKPSQPTAEKKTENDLVFPASYKQ